MRRTPRIALALALALAACSKSAGRPATEPTPARPAAPAPAPAAATGRGAAAPAVDTARYVRIAPPSDPVIQRIWTEGMQRSQVMNLAQVLFD